MNTVVEFLKAACDLDHSEACYRLGSYYESKDIEKSLFYLNKSIDLGNVDACITIGNIYEKGIGVKKNLEKALQFYKKALNRGYRLAKTYIKLVEMDLQKEK